MKTEFVYPQAAPVLMGTNAQPLATGGLTLRDYFAGQALIAFRVGEELAWRRNQQELDGPAYAVTLNPEGVAAACYAQADAMLAARSAPCPAPS